MYIITLRGSNNVPPKVEHQIPSLEGYDHYTMCTYFTERC